MYNYILIPTRLLFLYFLFKFETSILLKTWKVSLSHRQLLNNRLFYTLHNCILVPLHTWNEKKISTHNEKDSEATFDLFFLIFPLKKKEDLYCNRPIHSSNAI